MLSYCSRLCLDIMSAQRLLCSDIWAICTENVRCPTVISSSVCVCVRVCVCVCVCVREREWGGGGGGGGGEKEFVCV